MAADTEYGPTTKTALDSITKAVGDKPFRQPPSEPGSPINVEANPSPSPSPQKQGYRSLDMPKDSSQTHFSDSDDNSNNAAMERKLKAEMAKSKPLLPEADQQAPVPKETYGATE